jgi:hypothetical protein
MVRGRLCRKVRDTMRQAIDARPRIQLKKGQVMHTMRTLLGAILLLAATGAYAAPLCTTYTIKENVPRTFIFKIKKNANISKPFRLNASVDSQQGSIYCTPTANDGADCRVANNPQAPVVITLKLGSTDPDNMGAILAGFSAGTFSIGKGGWQLKCYKPQ